MSQFEQPFDQPPQASMDAKTSGVAVTSLVCSLAGIIPCCGVILGPLGVVLGVVGMVTIGSNPARKGKGIAVSGLIIGLIVTVMQFGLVYWGYEQMYVPVKNGPKVFLEAASNGNYGAARDAMHGPAAQASDETIQQFMNELEDRYGAFQSVRFDDTGTPGPQNQAYPYAGQAMPYTIQFENGRVSATVEIIYSDQKQGIFLVMKPGKIIIHDPERDDLEFPQGDIRQSNNASETEDAGAADGASSEP